jgi:hypothetical protein
MLLSLSLKNDVFESVRLLTLHSSQRQRLCAGGIFEIRLLKTEITFIVKSTLFK